MPGIMILLLLGLQALVDVSAAIEPSSAADDSLAEEIVSLPVAARQDLAAADRIDVGLERCQADHDYREGIRLAREQLEIRRRHLPVHHPDIARSLDALARFLAMRGDLARAIELRLEAHAILREKYAPPHSDLAAILGGLGALYYQVGDYDQADRCWTSSLAMNRALFGDRHRLVVEGLSNLAVLCWTRDELEQAIEHFDTALDLQNEIAGNDDATTVVLLYNLALVHETLGDYASAEPLLENALHLFRRKYQDAHPTLMQCLNELGNCYLYQRDFAAADPLYREALAMSLELYPEDHPDVAMCRSNLGLLQMDRGDPVAAERLFRDVLAVYRQQPAEGRQDLATGLHNLAFSLMEQGRPAEAETLFLEELALRRPAGDEHDKHIASCLHDLGCARRDRGRWTEGAENLSEAADLYRDILGEHHPYVALALENLALCRQAQGGLAAAESLLIRAAEVFEIARLRAGRNVARAAFQASPYRRLALVRLERGKYEQAWWAIETSLARALIDLLIASGGPDEVDGISTADEYSARASMLSRIPARLDDRTALVGWLTARSATGHEARWAYVLRAGGEVVWVELDQAAGGGSLERLRRRLRTSAAWPVRPRNDERIKARARTVHAQWFAPLQPYLDGVTKLIAVPTGPLLGVPLEVLVDEQDRYLIDRYVISYTPSAAVLDLLRERSAAVSGFDERPALLVGDPTARSDGLPRLPGSRREILALADLIPGASCLLDAEASEERLWRLMESDELSSYAIIHFATHALVDDASPHRSALLLAAADPADESDTRARRAGHEDGLLTAGEIIRRWRLNARLVTLSACETGLGREVSGEGYWGFAHAFLKAGAQALLVSLWRVEDDATSLLMQRFYANLSGSHDRSASSSGSDAMLPAQALREAKLWLHTWEDDKGEHPYRHPAFWGGFVLIGDPE